jgi:hypothetical protein
VKVVAAAQLPEGVRPGTKNHDAAGSRGIN